MELGRKKLQAARNTFLHIGAMLEVAVTENFMAAMTKRPS
jgi:hypothetical protein